MTERTAGVQSTGMIWRVGAESVVVSLLVVSDEIWPSRKGEVNIVAKSSERRSMARWAGKRVFRRVLVLLVCEGPTGMLLDGASAVDSSSSVTSASRRTSAKLELSRFHWTSFVLSASTSNCFCSTCSLNHNCI